MKYQAYGYRDMEYLTLTPYNLLEKCRADR